MHRESTILDQAFQAKICTIITYNLEKSEIVLKWVILATMATILDTQMYIRFSICFENK